MSDAPIAVTVRNLRRQPVDLGLSLDDDGYIVCNCPAPGSFAVDPELDLPDLQNMLELLGQAGAKKRAKKRGRQREQ